jgi:D-alanyl-D-alanine dipeptidase
MPKASLALAFFLPGFLYRARTGSTRGDTMGDSHDEEAFDGRDRAFMRGRWTGALALAGVLVAVLAGCAHTGAADVRPDADTAPELVPLATVAPGVRQDMRYHGRRNFMGRPVAGYEAARCWLTPAAAQALAAVQRDVEPLGLTLKVFDCYRPQRAVDDFVRWGKDLHDQCQRRFKSDPPGSRSMRCSPA